MKIQILIQNGIVNHKIEVNQVITVLQFNIMKKLFFFIAMLTLFISVKAQDSTYIYQERGMVRIDNLESVPVFLTPNEISYRLRGSSFILKDGLTRQEYNIGTYAYIFDEDTTGFADNDAVINYLNGFISNYVNRDKTTDAVNGIDYAHHEIHSGSHYFITNATILGSGDTLKFIVTTPNTTKWAHLIFEVGSSAQADFRIIENVTSTAGDTASIYNNNRNSSNTSGLIIESAPASVTFINADTLETRYLGSGTNPSRSNIGQGSREDELILKQNTKYFIEIISGAASNRIEYNAKWYEHTNKN